jgi:CheY-like chemotaxis protein
MFQTRQDLHDRIRTDWYLANEKGHLCIRHGKCCSAIDGELAMIAAGGNAILIVEDEADARNALSEFLRANGYAVASVPNGLAALDEIRERKPKLILLDLAMPVMDGYTFLDVARERHLLDDVAVVVTTAHDSPNTPDVSAVLGKPIKPEKLMPLVRKFTRDH